MLNKYYQQQLAFLRDLAAEFSTAHPALAPMLKGQATDPDVERLLEGVAFMSGLLQEKIDDEFPEIVQGLMQLVFPHYLRTLPSATIMAFSPRANQKQTLKVPAGVTVASKPVDGTRCEFSTCFDLEVHPLRVKGAAMEQSPGKPPAIRLSLELFGLEMQEWDVSTLRFYLAQDYALAADIYYMLTNKLTAVRVEPEQGAAFTMPASAVKPAGFSDREAMLPYPSQSFPGYRVLQEFFILPQKFLFFDVSGLNRIRRAGGSKFDLVFELSALPMTPPRLRHEDFVLFATPAINVFKGDADPIAVDHKKNEYRVTASGQNRFHYQVYSVDKVTGFQQGTVKAVEYDPFDLFHMYSSDQPIYTVSFKKSPVLNSVDAMLSLTYPPGRGDPAPETLSIKITATNGELAENLKVGDIAHGTTTSPELLDFRNIRPTTASVLPPLGETLLWRFLSLYSLNYFSLANEENIKALLKLYIFKDSRDQASVFANTKRVDGIAGLQVKSADRLVKGFVMRGQEVNLRLNSDHFASEGDMFLFSTVLDQFFASYASLNSFTRLRVEEVLKGETITWPARIGDRPLM